MINKKWLTEIGFEAGFQIIQPQLPIIPQVSSGNQAVLGPNPASFTATVPGGITGQLSTITIQARDSNGQSVVVGGNVVNVVVTGSNSASGVATDNGNGTYTFTYTPTVAGQDSIAITADTIPITGSPYPSNIITATSITKSQIISYLQGLPAKASNKVLSAVFLATYFHNIAPWTEGAGFGQIMDPVNFLQAQSGKFPAMIGQDWTVENNNPNYTSVTDANSFAINYWNSGGLNLAHNLWNNPWTGGGHGDLTITTTFHDVVTPGTAANIAFMAQVRALADKFALLQSNGVVVIFRPLPEVNGNWFWWGGGLAGTAASDIILLYKQVHDYMQNTRGLTNIIWVYNVNAGTGNYTTYYPGTTYVDIVSFDYYGDNNGTGGTTYNLATGGGATYTALSALNKILAISETGPYVSMNISSPNTFDYTTVINTIRSSMPNIVYYMVWDGLDRYDVQNNSSGVMLDSWIIDRSEVSLSVTTPTLVFSTQPSGTPTAGLPFAISPVIQLQDGAGHNVASGGINIVLTPSSPNISLAVIPNPLVTDSTGKAAVTSIIPTGKVGTYTMTAAATGYASAISTPFTVFPGAINPAHCTATINGNVQGQPVTIVVQAKDTWDNNLTIGGATVVIHVTGANTATPVVTDNGNGTYSATYTPVNIGTDTITITADGTAITGSPFTSSVSASGLYPNQPAGMTRWAEMAFSSLTIGSGSGDFITAGGSFSQFFDSTWTLLTDSTAPQSPPLALAYGPYPPGTNAQGFSIIDGNSPGQFNAKWFSTPKNEMYRSFRMKLTNPWFNHPVGTKWLGFISYGDTPGTINNQATTFLLGNGNTLSSGPFSMWADWRDSPHLAGDPPSWDPSADGTANLNRMFYNMGTGANIFAGVWNHIEDYVNLGTVGNYDGTYRVWVNGVKVIDYSPATGKGVKFRPLLDGGTFGIWQNHYDATFGGSGANPIPANQWIYLDHLFIATR